MSTEHFEDTQEKTQLVRDFLMDSKTFQDYGMDKKILFINISIFYTLPLAVIVPDLFYIKIFFTYE